MVDFRFVIGDPKSKKTFQKVLTPEEKRAVVGLKLGEVVRGEVLGLTGYEFIITGGSDSEGFPMRTEIEGMGRKNVLLAGGVGYHPPAHGVRRGKAVRGNTVSEQISQLNVKITKHGSANLEEMFGKKEAKPTA